MVLGIFALFYHRPKFLLSFSPKQFNLANDKGGSSCKHASVNIPLLALTVMLNTKQLTINCTEVKKKSFVVLELVQQLHSTRQTSIFCNHGKYFASTIMMISSLIIKRLNISTSTKLFLIINQRKRFFFLLLSRMSFNRFKANALGKIKLPGFHHKTVEMIDNQ